MNKFRDFLKSLAEKWKGLSKAKKISFILISTGIIASLILLLVFTNRIKYANLFTNLDPQDSARIYEKLKEDKVPVKVEGNSILVPEDRVDELRMSVISGGFMPSNGKGFELFDQSKFGVTDSEARIMYQRALEGELSRTIESFGEVEKARVHLVLPEDSVFARETEKARASVTLKLKSMTTLSPDKVKSIVSLISGSVKNLPKENIEVIDNNMNLLSENLFNDVTPGGTTSANKQRETEKLFESELQKDLNTMLGSVFGKDKIAVKVNADLDFDSKQITTIKYDKESILRSTHKVKETAKDSLGNGGGNGLTGDEYSNTTPNNNGQSSDSSREEETTNYEVGQTEDKTVKAPGEVRRMSVSVIIDGNLSPLEKESIKNIVASATGYSEERGDQINIEGLPFNTDLKKNAEKDLEALKKQEAAKEKMKIYGAAGAASLIIIIVAILLFRRNKKKKAALSEEVQGLDVVIGDSIIPKQPISYEPVLSDDDEAMDIEKEIRGYASKKPEQVAEVIKTWISEDER